MTSQHRHFQPTWPLLSHSQEKSNSRLTPLARWSPKKLKSKGFKTPNRMLLFLCELKIQSLKLKFTKDPPQIFIWLRLSQNLSHWGSWSWCLGEVQFPAATRAHFSLWLGVGVLKQQFPKCGPWTSSSSNASRELVRNKHSWAPAQPCWIRVWGGAQ